MTLPSFNHCILRNGQCIVTLHANERYSIATSVGSLHLFAQGGNVVGDHVTATRNTKVWDITETRVAGKYTCVFRYYLL